MVCQTRLASALSLATVFAVLVFNVAESQETDHRSVLVRVVDADEQPVADASVRLSYRDLFTYEEKEFATDESGIAIVDLPTVAQRVAIVISKSGYVLKANRWHIAGQEVPDALDFQIHKGTTIGGEVKNGAPVAGARVSLQIRSQSTRFYDDEISSNMFIVWERTAPLTDENGHWSYGGVPADATVRLSVTHPDYSGDQDFTSQYERESQRHLREQSSLAVLADGIRIHGQVLSPEGQPVSGANVCMRMAPPNYSPTSRAKTDENGLFRLPATRSGNYEIAVAAKDLSPEFTSFNTDLDRLPLKIQLKRGRSVHLRVVDSDNRPVRAHVGLEELSGKNPSLLYLFTTSLVPVHTDAAGRFEWNWAPEGELTFSIDAPEFETARATISADDPPAEPVVQLQRIAVLAGRVIDRSTKKPLDRFVVVPFQVGRKIFRRLGAIGKNGKFELPIAPLEMQVPESHLMIEHSGHRTVLTDETYGNSRPAKELVIEMDAADPINGVVVDPAGDPVKDAIVSIGEAPSGLLKLTSMELGETATDPRGKFSFPAPPEGYSLVVTSPKGLFQQAFSADRSDVGTLQLKPWGLVKGKILDRDGKPYPNCRVVLRATKGNLGLGYTIIQSERDGTFEVKRVPNVLCELTVYSNKAGPNGRVQTITKKVNASPGETLDLEFEFE